MAQNQPGNRTPGRVIVRARGVRGRRGDVILELENGKIALPRDFVPREWEWYTVEVEDRGRYAIAYLHQHTTTTYGVCRICRNIVDTKKFKEFGEQWFRNLLRHQRVSEIKKTKSFIISRLDALIEDLNEMISRLKKLQEPMQTVPVELCGYGIDSCVSYWCGTQECAYLGYIIWSLERVREELVQRRFAVARALDHDTVITTTPLSPAERVFVPGI